MTATEQEEIREIVLEVLTELGASVENTDEVPVVTDITDDDTTMPFINRSGGVPTGYVQISVSKLADVIASKIDPEEAFPDKMDALTQAELDAILYPSDDSSDDSSSE